MQINKCIGCDYMWYRWLNIATLSISLLAKITYNVPVLWSSHDPDITHLIQKFSIYKIKNFTVLYTVTLLAEALNPHSQHVLFLTGFIS